MNETVLVVDDEDRIRSSLRGILSDEGFRVLDTGRAPEVMDLIEREHPAVVLLDVWMPDIDGIELLRRIKSEQPAVPGHHDFRVTRTFRTRWRRPSWAPRILSRSRFR